MMCVTLGGGPPIEDLHDAGHIWENDEWIIFLDFDSGYGKIEISAIWQKFLAPEISGRRNSVMLPKYYFGNMAEISTTRNFGCQKFLPYRRNFCFPISRMKFQTSFAIIIFRYLTSIMEIFYGVWSLLLLMSGKIAKMSHIWAGSQSS